MVRAGRANEDISIFLDESFVGIGYGTNNFDVSKHSKEEINSFLLDKVDDVKSVPQYLSQIELFKSIKEGDIVLSPDKNSVHVGVVSSDIYLSNDRYPNRINVEWFDEIEKNPIVNQPKTVFEINNFDFENLDFISSDVIDSEDSETKSFYNEKDLKTKLEITCGESPKMLTILRLLLSDNRKFTREEIKEELYKNGYGSSVGSAGYVLAGISNYINNKYNEHLRQILEYDIQKWNPESVGGKRDNYKIKDEYRKLVKEIVEQFGNSTEKEERDVISPYDYFSSTGVSNPNYTYRDTPTPTKPDKYEIKLTRDIQPDGKEESKEHDLESFLKNPFEQAICVLGESGAGKSYAINKILNDLGHVYQFIIPSSSTTGLLSQFSPRTNGYIQSRLGKMIEDAWQNPTKLYTAVFDECHRENRIEMINDELLQAISKDRNDGKRFVSLDEDTSQLYKNSKKSATGNIEIPPNFGFIFISSKPEIFKNNPDFFNRVDLVEITEDKRPSSIEKLNSLRKTKLSEKKGLLDVLDAKRNQTD